MNRYAVPTLLLLIFVLTASCASKQRRLIWRPEGTSVEIYKKDPDLQMLSFPFHGRRAIGAVIFIHGGNWSVPGADLPFFEDWSERLTGTPLRIFSIEHRTAPDHRGMGPIEDCIAAIEYIRKNSARFGVPDDRIALVGFSSGGHVAMMAASLLTERSSRNPVRSVVAFYSPTDLRGLYGAGGDRIKKILDGYIPHLPECRVTNSAECEESRGALLDSLSPIHHLHKRNPGLLLIHGTEDSLVPFEQSESLSRRAAESGFGNVLLYPVERADHHFDANRGRAGQEAREKAIRFILESMR